ncbi:MAG TPA: hypothetical protein VF384_03845 [Planctomycetota bacterium]
MSARTSILFVMLAAAAAATALLWPAVEDAPTALEAAVRDDAPAPPPDAHVDERIERTDRVAVPPPDEDAADCRLRGRFVVPADVEPGSGSWATDGFQRPLEAADGYTFTVPRLPPGVHWLGAAWRAGGPRLEVVVREVELAPGQDLDLGALAPEPSRPARLRIEPRLLPGGRVFSPQELADAGLRGPIGLVIGSGPRRNAVQFPVGGETLLRRVDVPVGVDVAVHGVPAAGIFVAVEGRTPLDIRVGGMQYFLEPRSEPQHLVAGAFLELTLDYVLSCELTLHVTGPSSGAGWIELHVIDPPSGRSIWQRWATAEGATRTVSSLAGEKLLVASLVDAGGVTRAFARQHVRLGATQQLATLPLQDSLPARGTWDGMAPGRRLQIALREWPRNPLWRATVGDGGSFTVEGLPADQDLVAVDERRVLPVRVQRDGDELVLEIAPR